MKKPRHLSKDERALWDKVAKTATPIDVDALETQAVPPKPVIKARFPTAPIPSFSVGAKADPSRPNDTLPGIADRLRAAPMNMDAKSFGRMKRGKLSPDARIDLHGMTVAQAHRELTEFVLDAHAVGKRLVLVITGKGKIKDDYGPIPARLGVLRHQVPQWLALAPLRAMILQVTPAHIRHGGDGAYYVYLRRGR